MGDVCRIPLTDRPLLGFTRALPLGGLSSSLFPKWRDHDFCNVDAAAQGCGATSTLLVQSTDDMLLPAKANGDRIKKAWDQSGNQILYLRKPLGYHGFLLRGWETDLLDYLTTKVEARWY